MIAEAMGGGQSDDEVAHLSGPERDSPQPSPRGHVVIFLPALNEERAIGKVLDRIPRAQLEAAGYTVSIWVVDGNSTDRTLEVGRKNGASVFIQAGRGKGNGMRQAFDHLLRTRDRADGGSREPEFFLMLDADGTYPPEAIETFLEALAAGNDVVLGSRFLGQMAEGAMTPLNAIGNRVLSALARLLFGVSVTDVCTGMWGFKADSLRRLPVAGADYGAADRLRRADRASEDAPSSVGIADRPAPLRSPSERTRASDSTRSDGGLSGPAERRVEPSRGNGLGAPSSAVFAMASPIEIEIPKCIPNGGLEGFPNKSNINRPASRTVARSREPPRRRGEGEAAVEPRSAVRQRRTHQEEQAVRI